MATLTTIDTNEAPAFYDSISDRYDTYYAKDPGLVKFIKESLDILPEDASVLDIGSGTGIPTSASIVQSGRKLHGIDLSPGMIAVSRKNVPGGTFELVSMLDYTPTEKFDAAYAIFSFFHFDKGELEEAVRKWGTWVREGGWMFIGTICAEDSAWKEDGGIVWSEDGLYAENVPGKFMGNIYKNLFYTQKGWEKLLADNGFEISKTEKEAFQPEESGGCDEEVHFWIMARKVGGLE